MFLPLHVGKIDLVTSCLLKNLRGVLAQRNEFAFARNKFGDFAQIARGVNVDSLNHSGFRSIVRRDDETALLRSRAQSAMGNTPLTLRTSPLRASSPTTAKSSRFPA